MLSSAIIIIKFIVVYYIGKLFCVIAIKSYIHANIFTKGTMKIRPNHDENKP